MKYINLLLASTTSSALKRLICADSLNTPSVFRSIIMYNPNIALQYNNYTGSFN